MVGGDPESEGICSVPPDLEVDRLAAVRVAFECSFEGRSLLQDPRFRDERFLEALRAEGTNPQGRPVTLEAKLGSARIMAPVLRARSFSPFAASLPSGSL